MSQAMNSNASLHKRRPCLLVIGSDPQVISFARVLVSSMGCKCVVARSFRTASRFVNQKVVDAALIDVRSLCGRSTELARLIHDVRPGLSSRILLLTDGGTDRGVLELAAQLQLPTLRADFMAEALWGNLESWLKPPQRPKPVPEKARLLLDTLHQPPASGVRSTQVAGRHLVYGAASLIFHLWLDAGADPDSIRLTGQVEDTREPQRKFDEIPVKITSGRAASIHVTTNQFGEFSAEVDFTGKVTLDIGVSSDEAFSIELQSGS